MKKEIIDINKSITDFLTEAMEKGNFVFTENTRFNEQSQMGKLQNVNPNKFTSNFGARGNPKTPETADLTDNVQRNVTANDKSAGPGVSAPLAAPGSSAKAKFGGTKGVSPVAPERPAKIPALSKQEDKLGTARRFGTGFSIPGMKIE